MTYVDVKRENNIIRIIERVNGNRIFRKDNLKFVGYYEDPNGAHKSFRGKYYKKIEVEGDYDKFVRKKKRKGITYLYEEDFNPVYRYLYENYKNKPSPLLNVCFFDIEVDFDPKLGFAPIEDPSKNKDNNICYYGEIISITLYPSWLNEPITLCRYPKTIESRDKAMKILDNINNVYVFENDAELLEVFYEIIKDADVITGWNSEKYDIPYIVGRTKKVLGEDATKKLCLYEPHHGWDDFPQKRTIFQHKKAFLTYSLTGRIHIDYLELYRKHNQQQLQSYRLDYIGEKEVGMKKLPYDGSLYDLYNNDYRKFIEYNRRDVEILVNIDEKLKFIELANQIAHNNCVLIQTTMGSVALIEQAIINEAHENGLVVDIRVERNKNKDFENENYLRDDQDEDDEEDLNDRVAGAYVIEPKKGLHYFVGGVDVNSLYPSTIRTLNMGPETLVAQLKPTYTEKYLIERIKNENISPTEAAHNLFGSLEYQKVLNRTDDIITIEFEGEKEGEKISLDLKASEIYDLIFSEDSVFCLSANGTIFRKDKQSVISKLLEKWYNERKRMQQISKEYFKIYQTGELYFSELLEKIEEDDFIWFIEEFNNLS